MLQPQFINYASRMFAQIAMVAVVAIGVAGVANAQIPPPSAAPNAGENSAVEAPAATLAPPPITTTSGPVATTAMPGPPAAGHAPTAGNGSADDDWTAFIKKYCGDSTHRECDGRMTELKAGASLAGADARECQLFKRQFDLLSNAHKEYQDRRVPHGPVHPSARYDVRELIARMDKAWTRASARLDAIEVHAAHGVSR